MNWELAEHIAGTILSVVTVIAVIGGAAWGYFRFVRFRTLKPRLEFSFDWSHAGDGGTISIAILTVRLSNRGNTMVKLRKGGRHRCFLKYALITAGSADDDLSLISLPVCQLEHLDTAFSAHKWLEPSETIDDVKVLHIHKRHVVAVQCEVVIFGAHKWSASTAFSLLKGQANGCSSSEDEQEEYEESEAVEAELRSSLARAQRALRRCAVDDRADLEAIIQEAKSLLTRLKTGPVSDYLVGEVKRLGEGVDEYSR